METLFFYLFATVTVLSSLTVITARNPIHSVLAIIVAFLSSAAVFLLIGAEFVAMTIIIVYIGAVAVLFLFIVMMLDINLEVMRKGFWKYLPVGALIATLLAVDITYVLKISLPTLPTKMHIMVYEPPVPNTHALGAVLYTDYIYPFQMAGLVLLVAMVGSIVLTLRSRDGVRKQNASKQFERTKARSVSVVKVPVGEGVDGIIR